MTVSHLLVTDRNYKKWDEVLERNLDEMAMGLSRLKGFALDLNAESDEHDDILIWLNDKASCTDIKVEKQNKDMSKILKKWAFFIIMFSISQQICCCPTAFNFDSQVLNKIFLFYAWIGAVSSSSESLKRRGESRLMSVSHLLVTERNS